MERLSKTDRNPDTKIFVDPAEIGDPAGALYMEEKSMVCPAWTRMAHLLHEVLSSCGINLMIGTWLITTFRCVKTWDQVSCKQATREMS